MSVPDSTGPVNGDAKITIHCPAGREFLWVTPDSPLVAWEVGQSVAYRNDTWVVLRRTARDESLSFTLGLPQGAAG